jgi:hypothetical protein
VHETDRRRHCGGVWWVGFVSARKVEWFHLKTGSLIWFSQKVVLLLLTWVWTFKHVLHVDLLCYDAGVLMFIFLARTLLVSVMLKLVSLSCWFCFSIVVVPLPIF